MLNPLPPGISPVPNAQNSTSAAQNSEATPSAPSLPGSPMGKLSMPPLGTTATSPVAHSTNSSGAINSDLTWSTVESQCGADAGVKIMVYGNAGMGKTVLCATLPMPFVIISTENGLLSLSERNLTKIFIGLGLDEESAQQRAKMVRQQRVMIVRNGIQLKKAVEWLQAHANEYKSVAWDSSSETAEVMLEAAKSVKADGRAAYGDVNELIGARFKDLRDKLPGKHVCVVAKQDVMKDEVAGNMIFIPDFPGKQLGKSSPYWLDETFVIRTATDPNTNSTFRYLQTQPSEQYLAKDRSGMLEMFEKPDLSYLIHKMTGQ